MYCKMKKINSKLGPCKRKIKRKKFKIWKHICRQISNIYYFNYIKF